MHLVEPLDPNCPWASWARPNVQWCENNLCAFITTPANTYSNVLYCLFSYRMWMESKKHPSLRMFAVASMIVGLTSAAYHASYSYFFQFFDFVGMFCFCMCCVTLNARRMNQIGKNMVARFYIVGVIVCTGTFVLVPFLGLPVQLIVVLLIVTTLAQEWWLQHHVYQQHPTMQPKMMHFYRAFVLLLIAFGCSMADLTRVWCNPHNHSMNGHSMWHILTSIVLYLLFKFHMQFSYEENGGSGGGDHLLPIRFNV